MSTIGRCGSCDEPTSDWNLHEDPATGYRYCDACWTQHKESPDIPPGCKRRLQFFRWLYVSGRMSEWPRDAMVLN